MFVKNQVLALCGANEVHVLYPATDTLGISSSDEDPFFHHTVPYPRVTYPISQTDVDEIPFLIPFFARLALRIREIVHEADIDVVHAHWAIPSGFLCTMCCKTVPVVTTIHGSDFRLFGKKGFLRPFLLAALRGSQHIIVVDSVLKRDLSDMGRFE
ncbi:MAG: glycosyltransferase, partial [Thermoplasmata archaeon]|nr:glycosyltransferase [Thermoplasmata archaeon]